MANPKSEARTPDAKARTPDAEKQRAAFPDELTDDEIAAIEEGRADHRAGRVHTQEEIFAWLRTWGKNTRSTGSRS